MFALIAEQRWLSHRKGAVRNEYGRYSIVLKGAGIMSMYGESPYNEEKNDFLSEIEMFLENHPLSELLQIVADAVERKEQE